MTHNFLDIEPGKDRSNVWRNIATVILLVGAIVGGVFWREHAGKRGERFPLVLNRAVAGGDLTIPPPLPQPKTPELIGTPLVADQLSATSILLKDQTSGAVLYGKDEYTPRPIASITKLMSALVLLEKSPDWDATTTVIGADALDTHMYAGDTYTLEELWRAGLIGSSNKAMLTLASALDWPLPAFIERMNQKALELGMRDTHFTDPTGLEATNLASASDLALLLSEAMRSEKIAATLSLKEHTLYARERKKQHHMWNTNWLLLGWIPNNFMVIRGGKTGYIPASGYNFVMKVGDADGRTLDVVILGAKSHEARFTEARDVAAWAFANYQWPQRDERP